MIGFIALVESVSKELGNGARLKFALDLSLTSGLRLGDNVGGGEVGGLGAGGALSDMSSKKATASAPER